MKWIFSLPTLYKRREAGLLKSRLPLQFVQWKFSIQCRKTIKLTVLNSRERTQRRRVRRFTHIHSLTCEMHVSNGSERINIPTDRADLHVEYPSFGRLIDCFLRTLGKMSHSLNTWGVTTTFLFSDFSVLIAEDKAWSKNPKKKRRGGGRTGFNNAHRSVSRSGCAVLSTRQFGVSAAERPSNVVCGDALFADVHVHGCCGSVGLHTEPLGGCDWTGHRLGLTDCLSARGNVLGRRSNELLAHAKGEMPVFTSIHSAMRTEGNMQT